MYYIDNLLDSYVKQPKNHYNTDREYKIAKR